MNNRKIVIADDEPITRMDIGELLAAAGCTVVGEAADGFEAVEMCRRHRPDLVLLDIKMPMLDGFQAAGMIREEGLASAILFLTACNNDLLLEQTREVGAAGVVGKPLDVSVFLPAVERALQTVDAGPDTGARLFAGCDMSERSDLIGQQAGPFGKRKTGQNAGMQRLAKGAGLVAGRSRRIQREE